MKNLVTTVSSYLQITIYYALVYTRGKGGEDVLPFSVKQGQTVSLLTLTFYYKRR